MPPAPAKYAISSIVAMRCPRCRRGPLYRTPLLQFKIYDMYETCPCCAQTYEIEPGFWWGAMYIGYTLSSALMFFSVATMVWILEWSMLLSFGIAIAASIVLIPYFARLARAIWVHIYVPYQRDINCIQTPTTNVL